MARLLIIEDDSSYLKLLKIVTERAGHESFLALDGKEGMRLFNQHDIDLIITDIYMPEQDGLETIIEIKSTHPETKIIALSGGGSRGWKDSTLLMAEDLGADAVLAKPFDNAKLIDTIDRLIQ
jgi:DNA-binding response OmpR family regulator